MADEQLKQEEHDQEMQLDEEERQRVQEQRELERIEDERKQMSSVMQRDLPRPTSINLAMFHTEPIKLRNEEAVMDQK